jgi:hypothetical protein
MRPVRGGFRLAVSILVVSAAAAGGGMAAEPAAPAALAGTWTWTWKDPKGQTHRHVIEVEGTGKALAAQEVFDELPPVRVTNLKVEGNNVRFTVVRGRKRSDYSGKIADPDHINGTVLVADGEGQATEFVWKAERRKDIPK